MQADALAYGKTPEQLRSDNVPDYLIPHRVFTGNRPSMSIMLPSCTAYTVGQLLAIYEHRIAVQVREPARAGFVRHKRDSAGVPFGAGLRMRGEGLGRRCGARRVQGCRGQAARSHGQGGSGCGTGSKRRACERCEHSILPGLHD